MYKRGGINIKIAYAGYDILLDCLKDLYESEYEIVKIFTIPSGDDYDSNERTLAFARQHEIPVQTTKMLQEDMEGLITQGCQILICAGYTYRIPIDKRMQAINLHPALLPIGRGPWPMPVTLLKGHKTSGITIHKLAHEYDTGDILIYQPIEISEQENLITLTRKIQVTSRELLHQCLLNFEYYYTNAKPQNETIAQYWAEPGDAERRISLQTPLQELDLKMRAFAGYGCILEDKNDKNFMDMPIFRDVQISDMAAVNAIRKKYSNTLSAYTFPCIYCWRGMQDLKIYLESDWFAIKIGENDYYYPCGNDLKTEIFLRLLVLHEKTFRLGYISEQTKGFLHKAHGELQIEEDRNNYDYLVPMKQIAEPEGKHFHTIRKEIHQFERSGVLETEILTPDNIDIVKKIAVTWSKDTSGTANAADTLAEESAISHFSELEMRGILVKKNGQYIGFVMGTEINEKVFDAHFAKCIDKSTGADFYCKQQFCKYLLNQYEYMNMEEDMGIEGIRTRKMLFRPSALTPVYLASFHNDNGAFL